MYQFFFDLTGNVIISTLAVALVPLICILLVTLFGVWLERKVSAWMQDRVGPNRIGPYGIFQTVADFIKMLQKEDAVSSEIDGVLYNIAPVLVFAGSFAAFAVIPFAATIIGSEIEVGLFYMLAVSSFVVAGIATKFQLLLLSFLW
ncbi:MAG: NADH dehydrogenase subunit [Ignavibacteria bacterium]|nr:MAG: NADH dehydrogenase subunit [Ignavibacteria bacterium]